MNQQHSSRVLARWAAILREEGDSETADAIERQLEAASRKTLDEEDTDWLRRVLECARSFEGKGAYEDAVDSYVEALRTVEAALGASNPQVLERLSDLARCRFNAGHYDVALEDYARLLRLVEDLYGCDDALAATARDYMRSCQRGIRDIVGTLRLQEHMYCMLRRYEGRRVVEVGARADRIRAIALRLAARGRRAAAVRLHEAAIALRIRHADAQDEAAYLEIHRYAIDLRDAGEPGKAARALGKLVAIRNRKSAWIDQGQELHAVLMDVSACLSEQGQERSARDTAALAASIAKRSSDGGATERPASPGS